MRQLTELQVNDEVYVNKEGLEYIKDEEEVEHLAGYAFTSKVRILETHTWFHVDYDDDIENIGALYDVVFVNDPDKIKFALHDRELSLIPLHYFNVHKDEGHSDPFQNQLDFKREYEALWTDNSPDLPPHIPSIVSPLYNYGQIELEIKNDELVLPTYEQQGKELGALVDTKQKAYGNAIQQTYDVVKVFLKPYKTEEGYVIPEALLKHLLLMVRVIDKQNRIFNNPEMDLMGENPYFDLAGYGLLGNNLTNTK